MIEASGYSIGMWLFGRAVALSYLIAFASLFVQVSGLYGSRGILPIAEIVGKLQEVQEDKFSQVPSVFLWGTSDTAIKVICLLGILFSLAAFWGWMEGIWFLLCFVLYLSFVSVGRDFLSFQWDMLLLECGFVILLATPFKTDWRFLSIQVPTQVSVLLSWLLLFKLMFLSGVVKLASGDPTWRDLSAMTYHYWTQPLPNPVAWWLNSLPNVIHRISTAVMFVIELVCPFLIFVHTKTRVVAAIGLIGLQFLIALSGNYAFFNFLSLGLCLPLLGNGFFEKFGWQPLAVPAWGSAFEIAAAVVATPLALLSLMWIVRPFAPAITNWGWVQSALNGAITFRMNGPYGLFAVMTTDRPEIQIEGSLDGVDWRVYPFRYKPGDPQRSPPWVAPHQPRLDWQMWFAAMARFEQSPWLSRLLGKIFEGSPEVLALFAEDPFRGEKPKYLRLRRAIYVMTEVGDHDASQGNYWRTGPWEPYSPVFERP